MIMKGQKINDRYQIIKSIGEGGMANVYLAYDTILDREVAVKILRGDLSDDDKFVRRFQREANSASSLRHPNIVEMYDVGEDDGNYFIVMEYVDGKTIKQLLKKRGTLTLSEAIDIMSQLTDGMAHAHDSYIIHRDLKPQNIMIQEDGQIKITDFGIAMALNSTQLTQTNSVMGSVHYLPPEQASGKGCTIKSDIYSMGIIFYELLSGSLPFRGDNAVEIALKHMKDPLPSVRKQNSNIPQSVEKICEKAFKKCKKLTTVDVQSGVVSIGAEAFYECNKLTSILLPQTLTEIDKLAFAYCNALTEVAIPKGVTKIKWGIFSWCKKLISVTIPEGVTEIEYEAFRGCEKLQAVVIPESVLSIQSGAFQDCKRLESACAVEKPRCAVYPGSDP